jgi:hypothetical protein
VTAQGIFVEAQQSMREAERWPLLRQEDRKFPVEVFPSAE